MLDKDPKSRKEQMKSFRLGLGFEITDKIVNSSSNTRCGGDILSSYCKSVEHFVFLDW